MRLARATSSFVLVLTVVTVYYSKSQLAIEYAHRVREASPSTWVLWIHASSAARFELSVRDTLEQLKVPGRAELGANVFQLFRSWLRDERRGKWLIILHNVDDARFLPRASRVHRAGHKRKSDRSA